MKDMAAPPVPACRACLDRLLGQVDPEPACIDMHGGLEHRCRMPARHLVLLEDQQEVTGGVVAQLRVGALMSSEISGFRARIITGGKGSPMDPGHQTYPFRHGLERRVGSGSRGSQTWVPAFGSIYLVDPPTCVTLYRRRKIGPLRTL